MILSIGIYSSGFLKKYRSKHKKSNTDLTAPNTEGPQYVTVICSLFLCLFILIHHLFVFCGDVFVGVHVCVCIYGCSVSIRES